MMRAWVLEETKGPESYHLDEVATPEPGPGEVLVAPIVSGINHLDLWVSKGLPKPRSFPHIPGGDAAGVLHTIGPEVEDWAEGDEVVVNPSVSCGICDSCRRGEWVYCRSFGVLGEHMPGTLAERFLIPARNLVARPPTLPWEQAGTYGLAYGTAYRQLRRARLREGETLLVVGVGGGVASAALIIGIALGAQVYVTSTRPDKIERAAELGADGGFDSNSKFSRDVRDQTGGVDVVAENVGTATFEQSMRSLVSGGRMAVSGGTSGAQTTLKIPYLFFKQIEIIGSSMVDPGEFQELTEMIVDGRVQVLVDSVVDFEELPEALARMESGSQFGKLGIRH